MTTKAEAPGSDLRAAQGMVKRGFALGIGGIAVVGGAAWMLVGAINASSPADRFAFAAKCAVFPTLMLLAGVGAVANVRFMTDAINPLAGAETPRMVIHGRYVDNTLQQLVMHLVATTGMALSGSAVALRLVAVMSACFVVGRLLFWFGYLRHPMKRAPGLAMTMQPTVWALFYLAVRFGLDAVHAILG